MTPGALEPEVRALLDAPSYAHLATLRADGSPRSWVVWVGLEGDRVLICTDDRTPKAKDMRRDPRIALSVIDEADPYRMAALQGRVVTVRPDVDCHFMDQIAMKYTSQPFPYRGPHRICFVIEVEHSYFQRLFFEHRPAGHAGPG